MAVGVIVYVVVRVRRARSGSRRVGRVPRWLAPRPTPEPHAPMPKPRPTLELFAFTVTCPDCGDSTRLFRWTEGPDDKPAAGPCPQCGRPERHVDTGQGRGIRYRPN